MPKAARLNDRGRHDKDDLTAQQGSPDVSINGQPAVRVGDMYQPENHPASQGSATVSINGKAAVRIGDCIAGHAAASSGSPNVIIGDSSYGSAEDGKRPVYSILLSQVPGSADPAFVYRNYPYRLYHDGLLVQEGMTDKNGRIFYEYEPPLKGKLRVEKGNGDELTHEITPFASAKTRQGTIQRLGALGYVPGGDVETAMREANTRELDNPVDGVLKKMRDSVTAKMP